MSEINTYFLIDECGAFTFINQEMAHNRIPKKSHAAIQGNIGNVNELQKFAVDNLTRFNVDPETVNDREDGDYWKWYCFWDNWKKGLSDEVWNTINQLIANNESIDKYLPKETWRN